MVDSGMFFVHVNNIGLHEKNHTQKMWLFLKLISGTKHPWQQRAVSCFPWLEFAINVFWIRAEKVQPASTSVTELQAQHICLSVKVTSILLTLNEFYLKFTSPFYDHAAHIRDVFMHQWTMKQKWPRFTQSERLEHRSFTFPISCLMQWQESTSPLQRLAPAASTSGASKCKRMRVRRSE